MLDFGEEIVEFKIGNDKYSVRKPVGHEIKSYNKKLKKLKSDKEQEEALGEFLELLGLDIKVLDLLTAGQQKKLISELYDESKN